MPFKYQELMKNIGQFEKADGDVGAWVVVFGCAPGSAKCPDDTQTNTPYALQNAINFQETPEDAVSVNLGFLIQALRDKVKEIKALQVKAASDEKAANKERALKGKANKGKAKKGPARGKVGDNGQS